MWYRNVLAVLSFAFFSVIPGAAQNFSGLQNKKLNKIEDLGFALESLLGRLGGSVDGNIDSVVVTQEYEKELRLRIYYTGFQNAYFRVSTMSQVKKEEPWVTAVKFNQTERNSPAEAVLVLNARLPEDALSESPYLRIDLSKKQDGSGKVRVYQLQKNWKANASGIIRVSLQPIGAAANLTENRVDQMPAKRIRFDNKKMYEIRDMKKGTMAPLRSTGGNSIGRKYIIPWDFMVADINGTWTNTNTTAKLNSMIISNGNNVKLYNQDAIGSHSLTAFGTITQQAADRYSGSLTPMDPNSKLKLSIVLVFNGDNVQMKYYVNSTLPGVVGSIYTYTFYRKPKVVTIIDPIIVHPLDPNPPAPTSVAGPDKDAAINLWYEIAVDDNVVFDRPQDISNINMTVYRDIHPASGMFYMYPADYHLRWDADGKTKKGYAFSIAYGKQGDGGAASADAPVRFSATLTAGINNREINFVKYLLKSRYPEFKDLIYLPLRETVQSSFQNALSLFGVTADKISVISNTDLNNDVTVAWSTNPDTKEFIQTSLTSGDGIVASMLLKPRETGIADITIPAIISLSASRTLGRMSLDLSTWRNQEWTNATVYPLKLKYLHVLKKSIVGNTPIIYSWAINDVDVPSGSRVSFDNGQVPKWLDEDPSSMMWLSYAVDACDSCNTDVINAVTDGVSNSTVQQLRFVIPDPVFDSLKAQSFIITVRSKQADPKGEAMVELPAMTISKEPGKNFMVGPLFIPKGASPDFEYKIVMASQSGDFYSPDKWIRSTMKEIYLGKTPLQEMFRGIVPWIN